MSKMFDRMTETFNPVGAIISYRSDVDRSFYLEYHRITNGSLGAGKPLTEKAICELVKKVQMTVKHVDCNIRGVIPENLLYCENGIGNTKLVWYRKPEKRVVHFIKGLGIPSGAMWVPGLVYVADGRTLSVYAYKGNGKPKGVLYKAPFMNVYDNGTICLGNASVKKPKRTYEDIINYWEQMFWRSEFSHIIGKNPVKCNLSTLTKELIETGAQFPTGQLVKTKKTMNELLK